MSILSRLWLRVAHTGHLERMPEPEDGPIAPGIFEEDVDFLKAELALRKHENLTGERGSSPTGEGDKTSVQGLARKAKKARQHHRRSQLKERARLQREVKRLKRKQPR